MKIKYKSFWRNMDATTRSVGLLEHYGYKRWDTEGRRKVFNLVCRLSDKEFNMLVDYTYAKFLVRVDEYGLRASRVYNTAKNAIKEYEDARL